MVNAVCPWAISASGGNSEHTKKMKKKRERERVVLFSVESISLE